MSQEEPAWRAELRKTIWDFAPHEDLYIDQWMERLAPHIQAAEERGRREALSDLEVAYESHRCKNSGSPGLRLPCEHVSSVSAFVRHFQSEQP
ncbi:MAG: hypothetical protein ACTHON_09280 [Humibacter sp.]